MYISTELCLRRHLALNVKLIVCFLFSFLGLVMDVIGNMITRSDVRHSVGTILIKGKIPEGKVFLKYIP